MPVSLPAQRRCFIAVAPVRRSIAVFPIRPLDPDQIREIRGKIRPGLGPAFSILPRIARIRYGCRAEEGKEKLPIREIREIRGKAPAGTGPAFSFYRGLRGSGVRM